jgi:excisionase family DNA binding protein
MSAMTSEVQLYTVDDLAELWKLNPVTVYRAVEKGELAALRWGRHKNAPIRF